MGNLKERTDRSGNKDLFEAFEYDDLNRLTDIRTHDANGNQTSGKGRTLQYSSFDKLTSVTQNGHATTFNYGTGHSRYKRVDTDSSNNVTTTYYLGGIELIKENNQFVEYRNNLGGVQITTEYGSNNSSAEIRYLYKDHLGSWM